jgi:hypothetical protein
MRDETKANRTQFFDSWLIRIGVILLVVGTGPLIGIILAARLGLTDDPNPNPIGPGIMAGLSFLPSVVMILVGIVQVVWTKHRN